MIQKSAYGPNGRKGQKNNIKVRNKSTDHIFDQE